MSVEDTWKSFIQLHGEKYVGIKCDQREHIINLKINFGDQHSAKEPVHYSDIRH